MTVEHINKEIQQLIFNSTVSSEKDSFIWYTPRRTGKTSMLTDIAKHFLLQENKTIWYTTPNNAQSRWFIMDIVNLKVNEHDIKERSAYYLRSTNNSEIYDPIPYLKSRGITTSSHAPDIIIVDEIDVERIKMLHNFFKYADFLVKEKIPFIAATTSYNAYTEEIIKKLFGDFNLLTTSVSSIQNKPKE